MSERLCAVCETPCAHTFCGRECFIFRCGTTSRYWFTVLRSRVFPDTLARMVTRG